MGSFLSLLKRQLPPAETKLSTAQRILPSPGSVAPCVFVRNGEVVYAMCTVEERSEARLLLRVLREVGKVTLVGLKVGEEGEIEAANRRIPFSVEHVQLPWIVVSTSPEHSRPIQRQFLRIPASFTVRFRQQSPKGSWRVGKGVNLSSGGFRFAFYGRELPQLGAKYLTELTIFLTRSRRVILEMPVEVRWASEEQERF